MDRRLPTEETHGCGREARPAVDSRGCGHCALRPGSDESETRGCGDDMDWRLHREASSWADLLSS